MGSADTKQIKVKNVQQILSALKIGPVWMAAALTCVLKRNVQIMKFVRKESAHQIKFIDSFTKNISSIW